MIRLKRQQTFSQRGLLRAVVAALLIQSLFPSGYMPGSWSDGWVATLCPDGLPMGFVQQLAAKSDGAQHHHHHHHAAAADGLPEHSQVDRGETGGHTDHAAGMGDCQLGSALDHPLDLASPASVLLAEQLRAAGVFAPHGRVVVAAATTVHARAPPNGLNSSSRI